jgi:CubicO group peptidase (beta-lactamase class C family)
VRADRPVPARGGDNRRMSDLREQLRVHVERERERFSVPGCAVTVVTDGEVLLADGFGLRQAGSDLPVTAGTLFPIGSSTKTFTAALCAALVQDGLLDLDQPVHELLPGFRLQDPVATQLLTLRDCLSHRSGLPRHDLIWYAGEGRMSRDELVAAAAHLPASKPFRQTWQYNNILYTLAGHLAGRICGGSYEEGVQQRILDPLQMSRTNFRVAEVEKDHDHARPHVLDDEDVQKEVPYAHLDLVGPAGCINSCATDLGAWLLTLGGRGVGDREPLLSQAVLADLRSPTMPLPPGALVATGAAVGYGLGVVVEDYRGHRVVHHGGNIDGFSSQVAVIPEAGLGVAVLTNLGTTPLRDALPYVLFDELLGLEPRGHGTTYLDRWRAVRSGAAQAKQKRATAAPRLPQVRDLSDYAGRYHHDGYGDLDVACDGPDATVTYGALQGRLEHRHLEVFDLVVSAGGDDARFPLQFTHDLEAEVDAVRVRLDPLLPPLRFVRVPDDAHLTDELLDRLKGTYHLDALTAEVSRRGSTALRLSVAGGPAHPLRLVRDTTFSLDDAAIEFAPDGSRITTPFGELVQER